jgi:hypothetical protein
VPKNNGVLTPKQHSAIEALLIAPTIKGAAELAKVGYTTLRGWLDSDPQFDAAYRRARRTAVAQAIATLQRYSNAAVGRLIYLSGHARSEAVQLGAASKIIDTALKVIEMEDMLARIQALEERLNGKL